MATKDDSTQRHTERFRNFPPTSISFHDNLPLIIEIRKQSETRTVSISSSSSSSSINVVKFLFICFITTMRMMKKCLIWNAHSINDSVNNIFSTTSSNDLTFQDLHHSKNKSNRQQLEVDDDDSDKRNFRQEMKTLNSLICQTKNSKTKYGGHFSYSEKGVDHYNHHLHRNNDRTIRNFRPQNYRMANKMMQQHFVHANYLQYNNNNQSRCTVC